MKGHYLPASAVKPKPAVPCISAVQVYRGLNPEYSEPEREDSWARVQCCCWEPACSKEEAGNSAKQGEFFRGRIPLPSLSGFFAAGGTGSRAGCILAGGGSFAGSLGAAGIGDPGSGCATGARPAAFPSVTRISICEFGGFACADARRCDRDRYPETSTCT